MTTTTGQNNRSSVPSVLDPSPSRIAARAGRVGSFLTLPEVRWAVVSTIAFLLALATGAVGAPSWLQGGFSPSATSPADGNRHWPVWPR